MKNWKKYLAAAMVSAAISMTAIVTVGAVNADAAALAANEEVKTEGTRTFLYRDGVRVSKASGWITAGKYTYYFGKANGAAYNAPDRSDEDDVGCTENVKVYKIGGKKYGFTPQGYLAKGIYADASGKLYFFDKKTGILNNSKTKALKKASKEGMKFKTLKKLLGKYLSCKPDKGSSCYGTGGKDITYTYAHVTVATWRKKKSIKANNQIIEAVVPR